MAEEVSVILKENKGPDSTWVVVRGTVAEVRSALADMFDLGDIAGWTFQAVTTASQQAFRNLSGVANALGGTVISSGPAKSAGKGSEDTAAPWEGTKSDSSEPAVDEVLAAIESAATSDELKAIFAANKGASWTPAHTSAVKVRRKALAAAA